MRSITKDQSRMVTLHNINPIPGASDGTGQFNDGTPYRSVRASVGQYDIYFDPRLQPFNGVVGQFDQSRQYFWITALDPGHCHVRCMFHDGTQIDAGFDLVLNCFDTRT